MPIYINGKPITPKFGGVDLSRVMFNGKKIWPLMQYSYTVLSNIELATVLADGVDEGIILNGSRTFYKDELEAQDSYNITLSGGNIPENSTQYDNFDVVVDDQTSDSISVGEGGGTYNVMAISRKRIISYSHPASKSVSKNGSITMDYVSQIGNYTGVAFSGVSNQTSWLNYSGGKVIVSSNTSASSRTGTITFTQSETGETDVVTFTQSGVSLYSYTINSNCNGGRVYFNGVNKGTISNGKLTFTDAASSGTVSISGGVPSDTSSYLSTETRVNGQDSQSDTTTDSSTVFEWTNWDWDYLNSTGMDFIADGQTRSWTLWSHDKSRTGTRYRYRDIHESRDKYQDTTYSSPANRTVSGNSSAVTMNYTSSSSVRYTSWTFDYYGSWGSWGDYEYGSYSYTRRNVNITESLSWLTVEKTTSGSSGTTGYVVKFTATANTGDARSGYVTFSNGKNTYQVLITQAVAPAEYVFRVEGSLGTHSANATTNANNLKECGGQCQLISYKKVGSTYTRLSVSFASGGQPSQIYDYWASASSGTGTSTGFNYSLSCKQATEMVGNEQTKSYTVTMKQAESGKTVNITIKQRQYMLHIGNKTTDTYNLAWNAYSTNGNTGYKYPTCQSGGDSANWPTWIATSQNTGWLGMKDANNTSTGKNGDILYCKAKSNNQSFNPRKGTFTIGIQGKTNQLTPGTFTFNVTQAAAPNEFTINLSAYTNKNVTISRSNVTSPNTSSTIPTVVPSSSTKITGVLTENNSNAFKAPFTSYTTQQFKVWTRSGTSGNWTLAKTVSVAPSGTC